MVLRPIILPEKHLKANLFFPIMIPPNPPNHSPSGWRYQEGRKGSQKGEKQVDFKIHFRWFKAFLDHVFSIKGAGWVGPNP